ncbi:P-loop containing nucleoside triphosphate hydrolase protein [Syncephalis pseudoplumigaleata]|uniref:P-loop containing nucleoside triphosphate hydrolase protein n=1 Tax=Syncephalis pseudoplumigaleata TaxID=1712513 RepID=A0A4P9Z5Y3_9FUNG|nr:P-loop containing nucleoside triphosphate hydrolase protein [Syncephalis pseudoplumigaleata]|eukprot:RKP27221.1 P-loop containing nucleoside triphosphate hydrolase protein [Syncephalis pseudoplumigaleata]
MDDARHSLPVYPLRDELIAAVKEHPVLVVVGETGSGKTTQIPQYLIEELPERIAATSVAKRVATERQVALGGDQIGYTIRFDDCSTPNTRLRYVTDGVLLREATHDTSLSRYTVVIVDEAHERSLDTDVLLGLLKHARTSRPDLRILIMSATLNVEKFSDFFDHCPIFSIPGRVYPVEILHHTTARLGHLRSSYAQRALDTAIHVHETEPPGDILLFLTGRQEIEQACADLRDMARKHDYASRDLLDLLVYPLYAALDSYEQGAIFDPPPKGKRKIIVATNIAQTSVTIPGIRYVVDSGFVKQKVYDARVGMDALLTLPCMLLRTQGGRCYRIYSRDEFEAMDKETIPEIQRSNLLGVALHMKHMGIEKLLDFEFIDPPQSHLLVNAMVRLYMLEALDEDGKLTALGRDMAALPVSPFLSRALVAAARQFNCSEELVILAAMLSVENIFLQPRDEEKREEALEAQKVFFDASGDHCTLINVYLAWRQAEYSRSWCREHYLRLSALQAARNIGKQLREVMKRIPLPLIWADSPSMKRVTKEQTSLDLLQDQLTKKGGGSVGLYISPTCALADKLSRSSSRLLPHLEWIIFHSVTLGGQATMNVCSLVDPHWVTANTTRKLSSVDVDRLAGPARERYLKRKKTS